MMEQAKLELFKVKMDELIKCEEIEELKMIIMILNHRKMMIMIFRIRNGWNVIMNVHPVLPIPAIRTEDYR